MGLFPSDPHPGYDSADKTIAEFNPDIFIRLVMIGLYRIYSDIMDW
jgi:hypothetical protein